jgi:hypothetical protein
MRHPHGRHGLRREAQCHAAFIRTEIYRTSEALRPHESGVAALPCHRTPRHLAKFKSIANALASWTAPVLWRFFVRSTLGIFTRDAGSVSPSPRFAESAEQNGERAGVVLVSTVAADVSPRHFKISADSRRRLPARCASHHFRFFVKAPVTSASPVRQNRSRDRASVRCLPRPVPSREKLPCRR